MNNITYRRPARKSLLGTRLSILRNNGSIPENEPSTEDARPYQTRSQSSIITRQNSVNLTKNDKSEKETESLNLVMNNINSLLEKNSQTLEVLISDREQLKKIEEIITKKLKNEDCDSKENKSPVVDCTTAIKNDNLQVHPVIDELRSSVKYLKTPKLSRKARQSIILTPHSMSFRIQKQFQDLLEC